jgi:nicotinate-nucleotide adenylyltransferase
LSSPATSNPAPSQVGLFGGTFDPVHLGHLVMAEQCREQARLDEVWFVPAARPPHKQDHPPTPFHARAEMLALALAGNPKFRVSEVEKDRPGPSYTADTLEELTAQHPTHRWHFIIGSDSLPDMPHWHRPERILELAHLLIVERPGSLVPEPAAIAQGLGIPGGESRFLVVHSPLVDVSSRDLRRRVTEGKSVRYLVPRSVEIYIDAHRLYRS